MSFDTVNVRIGDIGTVVTGKTPPSANPEYWGDETDFITPSDFGSYSRFITPSRKLSMEGRSAFQRITVPPDSVMVTCIGSDMGKVAITKSETVTNQQINTIRINGGVDALFLYYVLTNAKKLLRGLAEGSGSTMPIINKSTFENISFDIPKDVGVQKDIAKILGDLDRKIELNRRMNETLEQIGLTLFRKYFVDNQELENGFLGDVIEQTTDKIGNQDQEDFVVLSAVKTGHLIKSEEYFTRQVFSKDISKYKTLKKLDFAYNPARVNIGSIGMLEDDIKAAVSPVYVTFRAKNDFHFYVKELLKLETTKKRIAEQCSGSVRQALRFDDFSRIKITKPTELLVNKFNEEYEVFYNSQKKLAEQSITLSAIRDILLSKLMSGEVTV